ncbi:MAG TPA: type II toxin-antitoxin system VapC family toxin [Terriglobia bacterium]|nr:type II toxin-antitoxin system VapC family toxin [Terriglobia bacterium]
MSRFVVDASVSLCWYFEEQKSAYSEAVLDRMAEGDRAVAPVLWLLEMINGLVLAQRFKKLRGHQFEAFLADLKALPVEIDTAVVPRAHTSIPPLARDYRLSAYDASYLELALFEGLPLATLDKQLRAAAERAGVDLFLLPEG